MTTLSNGLLTDIMTELESWVKGLLNALDSVVDLQTCTTFESSFRRGSQRMVTRVFERLMQEALERQDPLRVCPRCGRFRRHKGRRVRGVISSVGAIRLEGVYWYCPQCGEGQHTADVLWAGSVSAVMRQLLCLLGTSLASFAKASAASKVLLGTAVSDELIRQTCHDAGNRALRSKGGLTPVQKGQSVIGSCDGTMVNTRSDGWRELKAYQFRYGSIRHGRAYLERSARFMPQLRKAAIHLKAGRADRLFFVSDAATWIEKGVRQQFPSAQHIVDVWHAQQHVHEAARQIHGEGTPQATQWGTRYADLLAEQGARVLWDRLRRVRYKNASHQKTLNTLLGFLDRHADRMAYAAYRQAGWPISSGPMESFCKQLGQRLKGPGMRWSTKNVTPMATLVSLWANDEWESYWKRSA